MSASITDTTLAPTPAVGHYRIDPVRTANELLHMQAASIKTVAAS
jgi:hypothetical protein